MSSYLFAQAALTDSLFLDVDDETIRPLRYRLRFPLNPGRGVSTRTFLVKSWSKRSQYPSHGYDISSNSPLVGYDSPFCDSWKMRFIKGGQRNLKQLIGVTVDINGNVAPFTTVIARRQADDTYVQTVVSDAAGYFVITTPYTDAHYLVGRLAGSPDTTGAVMDVTGT